MKTGLKLDIFSQFFDVGNADTGIRRRGRQDLHHTDSPHVATFTVVTVVANFDIYCQSPISLICFVRTVQRFGVLGSEVIAIVK